MRVVVLGGAGGLGRHVTARLTELEVDVVPASRRTGVDLSNGTGLAAAVAGADAIVHAATSPLHHRRVDLDGTQRLVEAVRARGNRVHLIYPSIVGCDANRYPYYRTKYACEQVLQSSGCRVSVVRATQFHALVAGLARAVRVGGLGFSVAGVAVQPCQTGWVADQLADLACADPPDGFWRAIDLAGPETMSLAEAIRRVARHDGHLRTRVATLPAVGRVARAFARGSNLPGPQVRTGGASFDAWLRTWPGPR